MRLLTITHYAALLGANRSLLHLLTGLKEQHGVEALVFCPREGAFTEALRRQGIAFQVLPFGNWGYSLFSFGLWLFPLRWYKSQQAFPLVVEAARAFNPDIIHSNSLLVSAGWQLAETLNKPHVWHLREFGWADYRIVFPLGKAKIHEKLQKAARVICISKAIQKAHAAALSAQVIFNGIGTAENIKKNYESGQQRQHDGCFRFLLIGLLHPAKGQMDALRAFTRISGRYPQARLDIVGKGRKLYTLRLKLYHWLFGKPGTVCFAGYLADPSAAYARADAVLMCSRNEAMGRVTAEAMAYGKPVIAFNGGATPEIITPNQEGLLYQTHTELMACMERLLQNPDSSRDMGQKGYACALRLFSDEVYVDKCYGVMSQNME